MSDYERQPSTDGEPAPPLFPEPPVESMRIMGIWRGLWTEQDHMVTCPDCGGPGCAACGDLGEMWCSDVGCEEHR